MPRTVPENANLTAGQPAKVLDSSSGVGVARLLYDRKSAAQQLSISVRSLDYLIAAKRILTRRVGRKVLVTRGELLRFTRADHSEPVA